MNFSLACWPPGVLLWGLDILRFVLVMKVLGKCQYGTTELISDLTVHLPVVILFELERCLR